MRYNTRLICLVIASVLLLGTQALNAGHLHNQLNNQHTIDCDDCAHGSIKNPGLANSQAPLAKPIDQTSEKNFIRFKPLPKAALPFFSRAPPIPFKS